MRPISSHLDRKSLVNKGFSTYLAFGEFFLAGRDGQSRARKIALSCVLGIARSGSQSQRRIWFILPAHGASHIIISLSVCFSPPSVIFVV